MDFVFNAEQEAYRMELRTWLEANVPEDLKANAADMVPSTREEFEKRRVFQKKLAAARWIGIWWPREYGGRGAGIIEQAIYDDEYERAHAPRMTNHPPINQWGPTVIQWGTEAQKKRLLAPMLSGEETWCQGYSEPNAGSDLASLQTRALDKGDSFEVTGQKIWTSAGHFADWIYMLVRTDPVAPKHKGISCMYIDMHSPGVEVRPLIEITGSHHFNEVFFDAVRVPKENLVGPLHEGWRVAMTTLNYERAISGGHNHASQLQSLVELARQVTVNGHPANEDEYFRQQIAQLKIELESLKFTGYRALTRQIKGLPAGPELSMLKTVGCSLVLNMMRVSTEMLGGFGTLAELCPNPSVPDGRDWLHRLLGVRGVTIAGGTTEISRNIIGERTLGLPKS
jgi:alkylation response protein AidB-like acyl-CoA dehydrogenase